MTSKALTPSSPPAFTISRFISNTVTLKARVEIISEMPLKQILPILAKLLIFLKRKQRLSFHMGI